MKKLIYITLSTFVMSACVSKPFVDFSTEHEWMLCNLSADANGAFYTAETSPSRNGGWYGFYRYHVEEAKRRNLYCPTDLDKSKPRMIPRASSTGITPVLVDKSKGQSYQQNGSADIVVPSIGSRIESICLRRAGVAKQAAMRNHRPSNTATNTTCRVDYFGNVDCSSSSGLTGGAWGGALAGLEAADAGRDAYNIEYESCLLQLSNR
jgi:hypothetical protein